jgi:metallo-beta-lactamase class B
VTTTSGRALLGIVFALYALTRASATADRSPDAPINCASCPAWNAPRAPFKVFGNTYYVGTAGLSAVLITSPGGLILLDGDLPQSVPALVAHIKAVGADVSQVKLILSSHPHFDHAGGLRALQLLTGATVASSPRGAEGLERGANLPDDPQFRIPDNAFAPVKSVRRVTDGEVLRVGTLAVTAHYTPGHTPGGVSWTWRACEGARCLDVVYADSLTAVSADGYRFTGDATHPSIEPALRKSIAVVDHLPCDVLLSTHPDASQTFEELAKGTPDAFVDPAGCHAYAADARATLDRRVADEKTRK